VCARVPPRHEGHWSAPGPVVVSTSGQACRRSRSLTQGATTRTWSLDPNRRLRVRTDTGGSTGTRTNHYDNDGDSPARIAENATASPRSDASCRSTRSRAAQPTATTAPTKIPSTKPIWTASGHAGHAGLAAGRGGTGGKSSSPLPPSRQDLAPQLGGIAHTAHIASGELLELPASPSAVAAGSVVGCTAAGGLVAGAVSLAIVVSVQDALSLLQCRHAQLGDESVLVKARLILYEVDSVDAFQC
jgi:hypothetical protein